MKNKQTKIIVVRGVYVKVLTKDAPKFQAIEKSLITKDWEQNRVD